MIGLLLVTHAPLGQALLDVVAHVFGHLPERLLAIDVMPDDDVPTVTAQARLRIAELDGGDGVLVLTDLFGATPCNIAQQIPPRGPDAEPFEHRVGVVAGLNTSMLLRAISHRGTATEEGDLEVLIEKAVGGGRHGIMNLIVSVPQRQTYNPFGKHGSPGDHHNQ